MIVILAQGDGKSNFEEKGDVTRVTDGKGELTGFNFFNVDQVLDYDKLPNGEVKLDEDQVGFSDKLTVAKPTLVYGYVKECAAHPDSDHLHVTQIDVGDGQDHQIVCGAPNIAQGQKVVVALPGTLMPTGAQIWPGALRGVESDGMICSARELGLAHAPQKRGIMVVPDSFKIGDEFEPTKCDELLASGAITL